MKIKIKKIRNIHFPEYSHPGDSGMDIVNAADTIIIEAGERKLIPSGIKVAIPIGYELQVRSRSGLAINSGLFVLNSPGTIDAGYRGEISVILFNSSKESIEINHGMRIAQIVLQKVEIIEWKESKQLPDSRRNSGGFGSTG